MMAQVLNETVFATVSRWLPGVPSALNQVVEGEEGGEPLLRPFPSWEWQEVDNCDALQTVQSMEVDPKSGWMWIIDVGRRNTMEAQSVDVCPPKLVVYDLGEGEEVFRHVFPDEVLGWETNYVNDIVVDPTDAGWAYMSDTGVNAETGHNGGIVVYDADSDLSWRVEHRTMHPDPSAVDITILDTRFFFNTPSDGIALSPDGSDLFYTPLASYDLFSVPTSVLQVRGGREGQIVKRKQVGAVNSVTPGCITVQ